MAIITNHVFDYENELNDNLYNLKMSRTTGSTNSLKLPKIINGGNDGNGTATIIATSTAATTTANNNKKRKVRKMLKPLLRLLKKTKAKQMKQKAVPQIEIFVEEVDNQNNANEALEQRLLEDLQEAEEGVAITVYLDGQLTVVPVVPGQCYVPVHFAHTHAGDFYWSSLYLSDSDLCYKGRAFSQHQLPEMQVA